MDIHKKTFISSYIPDSLHFNVHQGVLQVDSNSEREIVLLDLTPSEETLKLLHAQKHLPPNIVFEATTFAYPKNASGVQGKKEVVAMCISTIHYQTTSPYRPWFASYPRALILYGSVVVILTFILYFFC